MNKTSKTTAKTVKKIDQEKLNEEIQKRAYEIFLARDEEGDALSDWLQAEQEIKEKYELTE